MKKGEMRKESIIKTAEKLFLEKGYGETSIQDILNTLSISKGGFYHYFDSKNALLVEICRQHSIREIESVRADLFSGKYNAVQKLNRILSVLNLFCRENAEYASLVLKVSYLDGDVQFRDQLRIFMLESLRPMVDDVIREGISDGSFFVRNPGNIGRILLMLGYDLNDDVCRILASQPDNPECVIGVIDLMDAYRECVETLCGASHGSILLFDLEQLVNVFRQTAMKLNLMKEY